jgi:predicted Ser/Thr protein kinase
MTGQDGYGALPTVSGSGTESGPRQFVEAPQVEGYEIVEEIGRGGMGVVYRARDTGLDRWVAVKAMFLSPQGTDDLGVLQREARLAASLEHAHIVHLYRFMIDTKPPCFIMELVAGTPLVRFAQRLNYKQIAGIVSRIARAVAYAHEQKVIHRDLKPSNILVDQFGEPRILDFGVARRWGKADGASQVVQGGTPLYMAPEQVASPGAAGPSADIYALGLILFELLVGMPPPPPLCQKEPNGPVERVLPLPKVLNPNIPEPLQRIVLKACEQKVEDRYSTARHLADDLDRFAADLPVAARPKVYARLVLEGIRSHLDDLALWESEGLVTRREHDLLAQKYEQVAEMDSLWVPDARLMRWGPTLADLGGWFVVLSAILLPAFYWERLSAWQRIVGVGVPTLIVNAMGILSWARGRRLLGTIFSATGAVLLPVFVLVLLSETHFLDYRQGSDYELLPPSVLLKSCNLQVFVALLAMLAYSLVLLLRTKLGLLAVLTTVSMLLAYVAGMLLLGMKDWLVHERFASVACWFWPLVAGWYAIALFYDRRQMLHLASPLYSGSGIAFLAILCIVASDAPSSWWSISNGDARQIFRDVLFIVIGLICLFLAIVQDRSKSVSRRTMAKWFFRLVPPLCVVPLNRMEGPLRHMANEALVVFHVPGAECPDVFLTEILVFLACLAFVALAVVLQWRWYLYYGLVHLAIAMLTFTQKHLDNYLAWPVAVMIAGSIVMLGGAALEVRRGRIRSASGSAPRPSGSNSASRL